MRTILLFLLTALAALAESAAGVSWKAPAGWSAQAPRPMRAATYQVPAAPGDPEAGECAVFYFGPGQGGGVEENIRRWAGQFEDSAGRPRTEAERLSRQNINGLPVHLVEVTGAYLAGGPMVQAKTKKPGFRLLGAIVEAPEGFVFIKLTGPAKTVAAAEASFHGLLKSLRR